MSEFTTAKEALEAWDRGDSLWSVEMGGLGPGYEQAIHVLVFEIIRDYVDRPDAIPNEGQAAREWADDTVHRVNDWPGCGFSGAQVGAAKHLAWKFLVKGHRATLDTMRAHDQDRLTQVSKTWPHEPYGYVVIEGPKFDELKRKHHALGVMLNELRLLHGMPPMELAP